jgi:Photosynthesis system II assembly factor YCF48/Putative zinc-finger
MNHEHPDANLLAAFTENRLHGREREELFAHLAECADCRQIVALSSEPVTVVKPRAIFPVWRWAAAAAAAAFVLTGAWGLRFILLNTENPGPPIAITRRIEPLPAPPATESQASRIQRPPAARSGAAKSAAAPRSRAELPAPPTVSPDEIAPAPNSDQEKVAALPAAPPYKIATLDLPAVKKAAPPQPGAVGPRLGAPMSRFARAPAKRFAARSRVLWRVNSPAVEQSLDGGVTWEPVSISDGAQFHAVAVDGADVWAGGANGALFLSRDAGSTWRKIVVSDAATALTGAIVAIRLPTPSEIILETDSGGQWISRDDGTSWSRL